MFVVFDLDGTLALIDHRRHLVEGKRKDWDRFFKACSKDAPHTPVIDIAKRLIASGARVEIWSGRSADVRTETEDWLARHGLGGLPLKMRPHRDYTPDDELKAAWLEAEQARPDLIFDDRDKVVAMWRRKGIVCAQVAPGDF